MVTTFSTTVSPTAQSSENGDCEVVVMFLSPNVVDQSTQSVTVRVKNVSDKASPPQDVQFSISQIMTDLVDNSKTKAVLPIRLDSLGSSYFFTLLETSKLQEKIMLGTANFQSNTYPDPPQISVESSGIHNGDVTGVTSTGIKVRAKFGTANGGSSLRKARATVYITNPDSSSRSQQNSVHYTITDEDIIAGFCIVEVDTISGAAADSIHMIILELENSVGFDSQASNTAIVSNSVRTLIPSEPIFSIASGGNKSAVLTFSKDVLPGSTYNYSTASNNKLSVLIREVGTTQWSTTNLINKHIENDSSLDYTINKINEVDLTPYKIYEVTAVASSSIIPPSSNVAVTIADRKHVSQSSTTNVLKFVSFEYCTVDAAITSSTYALAAPEAGLIASAITAVSPVWNAPLGSSILYLWSVEGSKDGSTFTQLNKPTLTTSISGPLSNLSVSADDLSKFKSFRVSVRSLYKLSATVAAYVKDLGAATPNNVYIDGDSKIVFQTIGAVAYGRQFAEPLSKADLPKPTLVPYMIGSGATRNIMMQLNVSASELASRKLTPYSVLYQLVKGGDFQESKLLFLKENLSSGGAVTTLEIIATNGDLPDFQALYVMNSASGTRADLDDNTVYSVRAKLSYLQDDIQNVNVGEYCDPVAFTTEEGLPTFSSHNATASVDDGGDSVVGNVLVNLTFPNAAPAGYAYIPAGLGVSTIYNPNGEVIDSYTYVSSSTSAAFPILNDRIKSYTFNILQGLVYGKAYTVASSIYYKSNSKTYVSSLSKSTVTFIEPSTVASITVTVPPHVPGANTVTSLTTKSIDKFKVTVQVKNPDNVSFVTVHVYNTGRYDQVANRVTGTDKFITAELTKTAQDYKSAPVFVYVEGKVGKSNISYLLLDKV
jgi:hypothetical protein